MREALRRRLAELNISLETAEEISGIQRGYVSKMLGEPS
jgi:hypothetical protein